MSNDTAGRPQIDFVWGNFPTQPNDERGSNVLDPILDSHDIVYNSWNGYPQYVPNTTDGNGIGSGSGSGSGSGPAPSTGITVALTSSSTVNQSTNGGSQSLMGRARLVNVIGGEQGGTLYTAAASHGLVGQTITFSSDVNGVPGADGGELSYFAGQTFTITASSSSHQDEVAGMWPASDNISVEWTASGPNYGFSSFTAGTATINI